MARLAALRLATAGLLLLATAPALATSRHHHHARSTPRHTPSCRRSQHVVYMSFERPELYMHVASHYTARALAGKAHVHHLNIVNTHTEYGDSEYLAKVDAPDVDHQGRIQRHDVNMSSITGYADLSKHYLHSSVNGRDYELLCMARFLALRDFCMEAGIDVFTHLDGDLAVFDDTFLDRVCIPANHTSWYYSLGSTFMSTLTCREVGEFADFLLKFYVRANRTAVVQDIARLGVTEPVNDYWRAVLEFHVPEYTAVKVSPRHISDMFLLMAFFKADTIGDHRHTPPNPYFYSAHASGATVFDALANVRSLFPDARETLCHNSTMFGAHLRLSETEQLYRANGTWHKLMGAHFQGNDCKGHMVRTLGRPLLAALGRQV